LSGRKENLLAASLKDRRMRPFARSFSRAAMLRIGAGATLAAVWDTSAASAAAPAGVSVTPTEALTRLKAGNARFVAGTLTQQNAVTERRLALTGHQAPFAGILSCSDSRVPIELLFDQNVGDLFVFRNAGNFVDPAVLGTMEYGYAVLGVKLLVVLGHEACGAVKSTYGALRDQKPLPPNLDVLEHAISPGIQKVVTDHGSLHAAVVANANAQAAKFAGSPVLGPALTSGDLRVVAADYDFSTGKIAFLS
jgi:carbonic anhydrase